MADWGFDAEADARTAFRARAQEHPAHGYELREGAVPKETETPTENDAS